MKKESAFVYFARFLKKYLIKYLWLAVLLFVIVLFIPWQGKFYLPAENRAIEHISTIIILIIGGIMALAVLIIFLRGALTLELIPRYIFVVAYILGICFFGLRPFVQTGIYAVNGAATKDVIQKNYIVEFPEGDKKWPFYLDYKTKQVADFGKSLVLEDTAHINNLDTLNVSFKKGLLGFGYGPEVARR